MEFPKSVVFFLEEDSSIPTYGKPLMLESVLFCPILTWAYQQLELDGVERFFVVCGPALRRRPAPVSLTEPMLSFPSSRAI